MKNLKIGDEVKYEYNSKIGIVYRKGFITKISNEFIEIKTPNDKIDIISKKDIIPVLKNYKEKDKLEEFNISLKNINYVCSIHAQKRMIERNIYTKKHLKCSLLHLFQQGIFHELNKGNFNKIDQFLKYNKKARHLYFKRKNIILVIDDDNKKILTAYKKGVYEK